MRILARDVERQIERDADAVRAAIRLQRQREREKAMEREIARRFDAMFRSLPPMPRNEAVLPAEIWRGAVEKLAPRARW